MNHTRTIIASVVMAMCGASLGTALAESFPEPANLPEGRDAREIEGAKMQLTSPELKRLQILALKVCHETENSTLEKGIFYRHKFFVEGCIQGRMQGEDRIILEGFKGAGTLGHDRLGIQLVIKLSDGVIEPYARLYQVYHGLYDTPNVAERNFPVNTAMIQRVLLKELEIWKILDQLPTK